MTFVRRPYIGLGMAIGAVFQLPFLAVFHFKFASILMVCVLVVGLVWFAAGKDPVKK